MKKIMMVAMAVVLCLIVLAQVDDELNSEVTRFLAITGSSQTSDAYYYLLGIDASISESPEVVGRQLLKEYRQHEFDNDYSLKEATAYQKLPLPTGALFCHFSELECFERLFNDDLNIDAMNSKHAVLTSRLTTFFQFEEYSTLTKPSLSEQYPPYQYISAGARINILNAINLHRIGQSKAAIKELQQQLLLLRRALGLHDNLIGKMVLLIKFSDVLAVLARISAESAIKMTNIKALTNQEKSFSQIAAREISGAYWLYQSMDRHPEFFSLEGNVPGWIVRMLFKPNMTINAMVPFHTRLERIAQLSPAAFAKEIENTMDENNDTDTVSIRNSAGNILSGLQPSYDDYVALFMDVDAKLVLVNHLSENLYEADNPYYPGEFPVRFSDKVCFRGPLEDDRAIRCLRIDNLK